ncbi:MAG TPA: HAMP domain-containing sensor histidine kinase [Dermatophilaceae bacterium]|nr:HAMP domain-containing sensor histidine kinase [Dermatophilaceae bacterium]
MRRALLRSTLLAVVITLALVAVPVLVGLVWLAGLTAEHRGDVASELSSLTTVVLAMLGVAVLAVLALAGGVAVSVRQARDLSAPLTELAERAERFGRGEARLAPLDSGIAEVDRVSEVLSRSAQQVTRNLASEREFAADASHQLRTPLTAVLMRLEEVAATDDLEVVREEAGLAIAQVERLSRVVDDLMGRSRGSHGERPAVSLDSVLASLQSEWQPAFAAARRSIHVHGERGLRVRSTPVALGQILSTLVENALVHGRGTVEVAARRAGPSVVIEMSDQGEGIPASIAPHVFERSVSSRGSGLGLTLARDLAESNGGRLELVSAQPAVFAIFLSEAVD